MISATSLPSTDVDFVEGRLPLIFKAGTPDRPYFVRRLTAVFIASALQFEAIEGSQTSISVSETLQLADLAQRLHTEVKNGSLDRGLILVGAAIPTFASGGEPESRYQLASAFAGLFSIRSDDRAKDVILAFQIEVMSRYGLDIRAERPSFD